MVGQFPPHIGGVSVHVHALSKELVRRGHQVYVITYPHSQLKDIDGIHVIGTKGINIPGIRGLLFKRNAKKELEKLLKKEKIDIIHGHYLFPAGAAAVEVGSKHKIKTYVTAHGSDMFNMYKNKSFMRSTIKKVLKKADVILTVSDAIKKEILKTNIDGLENKIIIHHNSVDINKFSPNNKPVIDKHNKPIVLFVGNLVKAKNVDLLLESKKQSTFDYELVIVGDGKLRNKLENKVKNENISDVTFMGARNDVENIIPACDVLVLPSFHESFGLVLLEALACGKPVIGSDVGGISEIITDDVGLLINPIDPTSLTNAIDKILNDDKFRKKLQLNARSRAIDFSKVEIPYR